MTTSPRLARAFPAQTRRGGPSAAGPAWLARAVTLHRNAPSGTEPRSAARDDSASLFPCTPACGRRLHCVCIAAARAALPPFAALHGGLVAPASSAAPIFLSARRQLTRATTPPPVRYALLTLRSQVGGWAKFKSFIPAAAS